MESIWRVEIDAKVATFILDQKPINVLSKPVLLELESLLEKFRLDPNVKCLVLTGSGMTFVAGADIKEIATIQNEEQALQASQVGQALFMKIENFEKPILAAINGVCLGGGLELAMACHMRICSDRAKLGQPEINLGIMPGFGGTQRLSRLVGKSKAIEWILRGDFITPSEALTRGLVDEVVPDSEVLKQSQGWAKKLALKPRIAVRAILKAIQEGMAKPTMEEAMRVEAKLFAECCHSKDMKEGIQAFIEKRQPKFIDE